MSSLFSIISSITRETSWLLRQKFIPIPLLPGLEGNKFDRFTSPWRPAQVCKESDAFTLEISIAKQLHEHSSTWLAYLNNKVHGHIWFCLV